MEIPATGGQASPRERRARLGMTRSGRAGAESGMTGSGRAGAEFGMTGHGRTGAELGMAGFNQAAAAAGQAAPRTHRHSERASGRWRVRNLHLEEDLARAARGGFRQMEIPAEGRPGRSGGRPPRARRRPCSRRGYAARRPAGSHRCSVGYLGLASLRLAYAPGQPYAVRLRRTGRMTRVSRPDKGDSAPGPLARHWRAEGRSARREPVVGRAGRGMASTPTPEPQRGDTGAAPWRGWHAMAAPLQGAWLCGRSGILRPRPQAVSPRGFAASGRTAKQCRSAARAAP